MNQIIEKYKDAIVQVITPFSFGSGFISSNSNLIITNYHIVKNNINAVVSSRTASKRIAEVLFIDKLSDIALLENPFDTEYEYPVITSNPIKEGNKVFAIGHPLRLKYTATAGIISKADRPYQGISFIQTDVPMNPGNSGGPLINEDGEIVGLNTMVIKDAANLGFSLPYNYLLESLKLYESFFGKKAIRCMSCRKAQLLSDIDNGYCSNCGHRFSEEEYSPLEYKPEGIVAKIESVIGDAGFNIEISRSGPFFWEIMENNIPLKIIYLNDKKLIIFDVSLCLLPDDNIAEFYEYMLQQNYLMKNHLFSLKNNEILLSFIIFEDDFKRDTCLKLFKELISLAEKYVSLLSERFLAKPIIRNSI